MKYLCLEIYLLLQYLGVAMKIKDRLGIPALGRNPPGMHRSLPVNRNVNVLERHTRIGRSYLCEIGGCRKDQLAFKDSHEYHYRYIKSSQTAKQDDTQPTPRLI